MGEPRAVSECLEDIGGDQSLTAEKGGKKRRAMKTGGREEEKEGKNLLGSPSFVELESGRFKCVETGHELPAHARDSYAQSKHCRFGLIDAALANKKPPLNMFRQDPQNRSKLVCKLTGVTINKSEEHIWKHINGKRFLSMLEKKELEKETTDKAVGEQIKQNVEKKSKPPKPEPAETNGFKKKKNKQKKNVDEIISEAKDTSDKDCNSEEPEFWMPASGERWDSDNGGDRWGSGSESAEETDERNREDGTTKEAGNDYKELSKRTKRMSIEIGPSSFASRKKKRRTKST